jgi:glycosyltransferase involved in cell wall biosynthesis
MFLGPVGLALARAKGAKFVWDVRDIIWNYAKDMSEASPVMVLAARVLERYMLFTLRRADLLIGVSAGITQYLLEGGADPDRVITVPNGISVEMLNEITQKVGEKPKNAPPVVTYAGVIGYNQDLSSLVDVARRLPQVEFVLAGDGPELPLLKRRAAELGVKNLSFRGYLSREKLLQVYAESDILFAQTRNAPTINATMVPVKLFEYMATGRPIVYAGNGIASELLNRIGCAKQARPEDPTSISAAILELLQDPERMRELGRRGRATVQRDFHRDKLMEELACNLEVNLA